MNNIYEFGREIWECKYNFISAHIQIHTYIYTYESWLTHKGIKKEEKDIIWETIAG